MAIHKAVLLLVVQSLLLKIISVLIPISEIHFYWKQKNIRNLAILKTDCDVQKKHLLFFVISLYFFLVVEPSLLSRFVTWRKMRRSTLRFWGQTWGGGSSSEGSLQFKKSKTWAGLACLRRPLWSWNADLPEIQRESTSLGQGQLRQAGTPQECTDALRSGGGKCCGSARRKRWGWDNSQWGWGVRRGERVECFPE